MIDPKNFIKDFRELYLKSPQCGSWTRASENCDYGDITTVSKDCYMCFNSGNCRNAYYCEDCRALNDCTDCEFCEGCELCYECVDCDNCYNSNFSQDCTNCNDVHFSYDLRRCKNCVGCAGLRDKEYFIFNKQYSKEDYENFFATSLVGNPSCRLDEKVIKNIYKRLEELKRKTPRMYVHQFDTANCTGDYIYHSKNCHMCFDTRHTEDSAYITQANLDMGTKDSIDCGPIPTGMDLCYDASYSHFLFNCNFIYWCGNLKDCEYCMNCFESEHLFGCHYMQKKQGAFYILNEKVDEKFYFETIKEIKKELKSKGIYNLYDLVNKDLSEGKIDISDDVLSRECTICEEPFEIIPIEVEFYKKRDLMFPIYCPNCRAEQRVKLRNERKMYKRICDGCKKTLISTFPPDSKYSVYCLPCYWKHIN